MDEKEKRKVLIANARAQYGLCRNDLEQFLSLLSSGHQINRKTRNLLSEMMTSRTQGKSDYYLDMVLKPKHLNLGPRPEKRKAIRDFWVRTAMHYYRQGYYDLSASEKRSRSQEITSVLQEYISINFYYERKRGLILEEYNSDTVNRMMRNSDIKQAAIRLAEEIKKAEVSDWSLAD